MLEVAITVAEGAIDAPSPRVDLATFSHRHVMQGTTTNARHFLRVKRVRQLTGFGIIVFPRDLLSRGGGQSNMAQWRGPLASHVLETLLPIGVLVATTLLTVLAGTP